jgi:excisionase family DNA binding protein
MATTLITTSFAIDEFKLLIAECVSQSVKEEMKSLTAPAELSNILTRQDTAKILNISLPTLHDYTKRGLIKAHRLGSKVRYKRDEVHAALQQIRTGNI